MELLLHAPEEVDDAHEEILAEAKNLIDAVDNAGYDFGW